MEKQIQKLEKEKKRWEQSSVPVQTYQDLMRQMEKQKADSKAKIADLELKLRVMAKRLREAEQGGKWKKLAEKLKEENKKLQESLEMKDNELADKNQTIESNQTMIEKLEKTIRELLDEKGMLVEVNQKQADQVVKLEVENTMLKERLRLAEERANRLPEKTGDPEVDSLIDQMKELQEELKKERETRYDEETKRKEKEKEVDRLLEEIEELKKGLGQKDSELIVVRETVTIKEKEIIKLRKRVKDNEGLEEKVEELKRDLDKEEREKEKLREKLEREKEKNNSSEEEIEELKRKLGEEEQNAESERRKVKERDDEIEDLERKVRKKDDEIDDLERKLKNKEDELDELRRKLRNKEEEAEDLERKLKSKEEQIEDLERKVKKKEEEIEELERKLKDSQEMCDRLEEQLRVVRDGTGDQDEKIKKLTRERDRLEVEGENLRNKVRELKDEVKDRDGEIEKLREQIKKLENEGVEKDEEIENLKNDSAAKEDEIERLKAELEKKGNDVVKVQETITIREKELVKIKEKPKKKKKKKRKPGEEIIEYEEYSEYEDLPEEREVEGGVGGPRGGDDRNEMIQRIYELEFILEREKVEKTVIKRIREGLKKQREILRELGDKEGGEIKEEVEKIGEKWDKRDREREIEDQKEAEAEQERIRGQNQGDPTKPNSEQEQANQKNSAQENPTQKDQKPLLANEKVIDCADELDEYNKLLDQMQSNYQKEDPSKVDENYKFIVQGLHSDYVKKPLFQEREKKNEYEEMMEDIQRQIESMEGVPAEYRNVLHNVHKETGKEDFEKKEEKNQWEQIQNDILQKMREAEPVQIPLDNSKNEALREDVLKKVEEAVDSNERAWALGARKQPREDWKQEDVDPKDEEQFLKSIKDYMDRNQKTSNDIEKMFKSFQDLDYEGLVEIYHYMSLTDMFMSNTSKRYSQDKTIMKRFKKNVSKNDELLKILSTLSEMAKFLTKKITSYEPRHSKWLTVQSEQILFTKKIEKKLDEFISNDKRGTIALAGLNTSMLEKDLDAVQENNHNRLEKIYNFLDQIIHVEQMDEKEIEDLNRRLADLRMALGRQIQKVDELRESMEETRGIAEREPARSDWKEGEAGQTESEILNELNRGLKELGNIDEDTKEAIRMRDLLEGEEKESAPATPNVSDQEDWEEVEKMAREQMLEDYKRLANKAPEGGEVMNVVTEDPKNVNMMKKKNDGPEKARFDDSVLIDEGIIDENGTLPEKTKKYLRKIRDLRDQEQEHDNGNRFKAQSLLAAAKKCYEEQHLTLEKGRREIIHQEDLEESHHRKSELAKIPKASRKSRLSENRDQETAMKLTHDHILAIEKYSLEIRDLFGDIENLKKQAEAGKRLGDITEDLKDKVKKGEEIVELASGQPQKAFEADEQKPDWEKAQDYLLELHEQDNQLENILRRQRKDLGDAKGHLTGVENDLKALHQQAEGTLEKQISAYNFMTKREVDDPVVKEDPEDEVHDIIAKTKKKLGRVDYYIKKMERQLRTNEDLEYEDLSIIYHSLNSMNGFISSIASKKTTNPKFQEHFDRKILRELGTLECLEINKQFCLFVKSRFAEFKNIIIDWVKFAEENVEVTKEIEAHVDSLVLSQSLKFDMSKYQSFEEGHNLGSQLRDNLTRLKKIDLFIERVGHEGIGGGKEDEAYYIAIYRRVNTFKEKFVDFMEQACDDEFDGIREFPKDIGDLGLEQIKGYIKELITIMEEQMNENSDYVIDRIENIIKMQHELKLKAQRLELKNEDLEKTADRRTQVVAQMLIKCTVLVARLQAIEG